MTKQVFELNEDGSIREVRLMTDEEIEESDKTLVTTGWNIRLFEPKWDFENEEWVEGLTDEEVQQMEQEIIQQQSQLNEADMQALAILELATEIEKLKGGS